MSFAKFWKFEHFFFFLTFVLFLCLLWDSNRSFVIVSLFPEALFRLFFQMGLRVQASMLTHISPQLVPFCLEVGAELLLLWPSLKP